MSDKDSPLDVMHSRNIVLSFSSSSSSSPSPARTKLLFQDVMRGVVLETTSTSAVVAETTSTMAAF